jgi:hypothetical protein
MPSFEAVIPNFDHRICMRHLYANFQNEGHKGLLLKDKLWKVAAAYTMHEFQREMELKNMSGPAHDYLEKVDPLLYYTIPQTLKTICMSTTVLKCTRELMTQ